MNLARKAGAFGDEYKFGFDDHDKEKITYATIGQTSVEINTTANRDVNELETVLKDDKAKLSVKYTKVNYKEAIDNINEKGGVLSTLWNGVVDGIESVGRAMAMGVGAMVPNPVSSELQEKLSELELTQGGRVDEEVLKLLRESGYESQTGYKYLDLVMVKVFTNMKSQGLDSETAAVLTKEVLNHMINKIGLENFPIIEEIKGDLWNISVGCAYSSECSKFLTSVMPETVEFSSYLTDLALGKKIRKELAEPKNSGVADPFSLELEDDYKHKPKPKIIETFEELEEFEDAEEVAELEMLREMIFEWDYEASVKAAKARIEVGGVTERNLISELLVPNAEASDGSKPNEEEGWISKETKEYLSKKLVEYAMKPESERHGLELIQAIIGYDLHIIGAGISEVEKDFPKLGKAVDKITEILNKPFEIIGEKVSAGYSLAKEGLINEIGEKYGKEKSEAAREYIAAKERAVGRELYKFAPDEKQERTLKYIEVIGVGKLLKDVSLFGVKKLEELIENTSFSKLSSTYLKENWYQSTFGDLESTVKYHTIKHGKGRSPEEYTRSAAKFFSENSSQAVEVVLRDGTTGLKIKIKQRDLNGKVKYVGGYFTKDGKIVTFFD